MIHSQQNFGWTQLSLPGIMASSLTNFDVFAVSWRIINQHFWRLGMGTLALKADERVATVEFSKDFLVVGLMDGRQISVPLKWYPRLASASTSARSNWELCGGGYGLHWPDVDEDLSTEGMLRGAPAPIKDYAYSKIPLVSFSNSFFQSNTCFPAYTLTRNLPSFWA